MSPLTRTNYRKWAWRVVTWDGVMPLVMFGVPHLVACWIPNFKVNDVGPGILIFPFAGQILRLFFGLAYINENSCADDLKSHQQKALCIGITVLASLDFLMAMEVFDKNLGKDPTVWPFFLALFLFSLPWLIFAMYPGRESDPRTRIGNWDVE